MTALCGPRMNHQRSEFAKARRRAKQIILASSYRDYKKAETVCLMSRSQVLSCMGEGVNLGAVPDVVKGLVLVDSRGEGSLQR